MTSIGFLVTAAVLVILACLVSDSISFAPPVIQRTTNIRSSADGRVITLNMGFFDDKERDALTRDSEPKDYFQTNTDKMSDEEKIPIAIAGLVGISLPFILGLIALYAARG